MILSYLIQPYMEPKQKLSEALEKFSLDKSNFVTLQHGDMHEFWFNYCWRNVMSIQ
jgi:hypothetical protein